MLLRKLTKLLLAASLMLTFAGAVTVFGEAEKTKAEYNTKPCKDYDRTSSDNEEKTSGDCQGTVPTPEPVSIILFTAGLAGVGFAARRRLRRSES